MTNQTWMFSIVCAGVLAAGPALAQVPAVPVPPAPPPVLAPAVPPVAVPLSPPPMAADIEHLYIEASKAKLAASWLEERKGKLYDKQWKTQPMVDRILHGTYAAYDAAHALTMVYGAQDTAQATDAREKARAAAAAQRERDRENRIWEEGYRHVMESRWDRAIERFNDVITARGPRIDSALYWKAYAQDRAGQRADALATIGTLLREHPNSRYTQQAKALEVEVRRNAGQPVQPQDQADEELKLMAIAALQHQAPEQAVPMLEKLLAGTASPKLKERALFVLAQSNTAQAREVLGGIAKGNSTPELQSRAITYLGTHGGRESRAILGEVYGATSDVDMKKRILRAFMTGGEKDRLLAAAQSEQNPELRATAVQQLGVMGAHAELAQLYAKESSVDVKKQIIQAMHTGGNATRMLELARTEQNPELRRTAIRSLGMMGGKANADALVEIYASEKDPAVKRSIIQALGAGDHAAALVSIARKEQDPSIKKDIVQRLSHMQHSKVAMDYLLEILSK